MPNLIDHFKGKVVYFKSNNLDYVGRVCGSDESHFLISPYTKIILSKGLITPEWGKKIKGYLGSLAGSLEHLDGDIITEGEEMLISNNTPLISLEIACKKE